MTLLPIAESVLYIDQLLTHGENIAGEKKDLILHSPYEAFYEAVIRLAGAVFETPVAILSLIDEENNWISSTIGPETFRTSPLKEEFWRWVVKKSPYFEVPDTSINHDVCHPFVTNTPIFRFYAGAHIIELSGRVMGTLCVFDLIPNRIHSRQRSTLIGLADIIGKSINIKNHLPKLF